MTNPHVDGNWFFDLSNEDWARSAMRSAPLRLAMLHHRITPATRA